MAQNLNRQQSQRDENARAEGRRRSRGGLSQSGASRGLARLVCWLVTTMLAASPASAADSTLELALRLEKGHFAVDRAGSQLDLTSAFKAASALDPSEVAQQLYDDVDHYLVGQQAPYLAALDAAELAAAPECGDASSGEAVDITPVCALSTKNFADAQRVFDAWADDARPGDSRLKLAMVLFQQLGTIADGLSRSTALFRGDGPSPGIGQGRLRFLVVPPMAVGEIELQYRNGATATTAALPPDAIRRVLRPLEGRLWRADDIRQRLKQVYGQRLGLQSSMRVSRAGQPRRLGILESSRISRILLPKPSGDGEADHGGPSASKVLFFLLEDRWYRQVMADGALDELTSVGDEFWALDIGSTFGVAPDELPYLDSHQLQSQLLDMASVGYSATPKTSAQPASDENHRYVDLVALKLDGDADSQQSAPPEPPDPAAVSDPSGDRTDVDRVLDLARVSAFKNFIGFGVDWLPDQGAKAFALYRRRPVAGEQGDLTVIAGGSGETIGSVNYSDSFVPVGRLRRPLSLSVEAGNDFVRNRRFGPAELDERRRGGRIHASLELYRQRRGDSLSVSAGFRDLEVEILDGERTSTQRDLSLLELGLTWSRARRLRPQPSSFELRATLTYGFERDDAPSFERLEAQLSYHRDLWGRFAWDQRLHLGWASGETPSFELPSLGGAESLRGFRSDTVLGEDLWSLQTEVWAPITPSRMANRSRLLELMSQLRLAIFVDVGDVDQASLGEDGLRAGAGLGLRYRRPPVTLALDWGYGFESPLSSERESKIYLSFRRLLP